MKRSALFVAVLAAAAWVGPAVAQSTSLAPPAATATPPASGNQAAGSQQGAGTRVDPTAPQTRGPATTAPPSGRGLNDSRTTTATPPRADALGAGSAGTLGSNLPAIGGVTPNRAELPGSAFTKLDSGSKGFVTLDDVRQLDNFESAFRQADQNRDGRLNASEFNMAWGIWSGNVR